MYIIRSIILIFKMSEKLEKNHIQDVEMSDSEIECDNLIILREFNNITNLVKNEDFLHIVPKAKLKRVKWMLMFDCLKQSILNEMVQELSSMWHFENMVSKIEVIEKQKEKFEDKVGPNVVLWRPQLNDVKAQLRTKYVALLKKEILIKTSLAKEYEAKVNRLQKTLSAKRGYLTALRLDIQMCLNKNEELLSKLNNKLHHHSNIIRPFVLDNTNTEICWKEKDMETNEINL